MEKVDPNFMSLTKLPRRVKVTNVPLYLGLTKEDLKNIVRDYIIDNCLNDLNNQQPVLDIDINYE